MNISQSPSFASISHPNTHQWPLRMVIYHNCVLAAPSRILYATLIRAHPPSKSLLNSATWLSVRWCIPVGSRAPASVGNEGQQSIWRIYWKWNTWGRRTILTICLRLGVSGFIGTEALLGMKRSGSVSWPCTWQHSVRLLSGRELAAGHSVHAEAWSWMQGW